MRCFPVPAAYLGGYLHLPASVFNPLVGLVLLVSAFRLFFHRSDAAEVSPPTLPTAMGVGAGIGLLAGLTGTGGGIFLTPLLVFRRWAHTRPAAAVSALFILVNSIAALLGYFRAVGRFRVCLVAGGPRRGWWHAGSYFRQPTVFGSHGLLAFGSPAHHGGHEVDFHQMTMWKKLPLKAQAAKEAK